MWESGKITEELLNSVAADDFAGYDPFDGLNSKIFDKSPLSQVTFFRLAWLQFHKRMPINLRPLCLVPKKRNPKGVGLIILGLLLEYERSAKPTYLAQATELGNWLLTQTSAPDQWKHACWGYHFDWQARAFYVPKGKPNIITTCYVSRALMALGDATQDSRFTESAHDSAHFIVKSLYNNDPQNPAFAYIPGEKAFVHNASLWGAALVAQIAQRTDNQAYLQMAYDVAMRSLREQGRLAIRRPTPSPIHRWFSYRVQS
jgi:polysaccharide biosynthesis protein VpsJ